MADADTNTFHLITPGFLHNIPEPVVTAVTTFQFEADHSRLQIQLIINHQDFLIRNTVEAGERYDAIAAQIHESLGRDNADGMVVKAEASDQPLIPLFIFQCEPEGLLNFLNKPEAGIVTGMGVLVSWITQTGD